MTDLAYLDQQSPKTLNRAASPPRRTAEYLEAMLLEKDRRIAELDAALEYMTIERARYINIVQADTLDPNHRVHHHARGREKVKDRT